MEGGFSEVLLLKKEDGSELIAKIPCPNAGPPSYVTASEAAVMEYGKKMVYFHLSRRIAHVALVRTHTTVPLPRAYTWNSNPSNPVGAEYVLMEKARGIQLFKVWDQMDDASRFRLMIELVKLERQLTSIKFPASGSLYFRKSMVNEVHSVELPRESDPESLYCIGLSCDRSWWPTPSREAIRHHGPCKYSFTLGISCHLSDADCKAGSSFTELGVAVIERESQRIIEQPRVINSSPPRGTHEEQLALLKAAGQIMGVLHSYSPLARFSQPTLYHTDLHMGNI